MKTGSVLCLYTPVLPSVPEWRVYMPLAGMIFVVVADVPLVEFMYFLITRMPGESYRR